MKTYGLIKQLSQIDTVSLLLLKKIYSLYKKRQKEPMPMEFLKANTPEYTEAELEASLSKLKDWAYIDMTDKELHITQEGISLIEGNKRLKTAEIVIEAIVAIVAVGILIVRYM